MAISERLVGREEASGPSEAEERLSRRATIAKDSAVPAARDERGHNG